MTHQSIIDRSSYNSWFGLSKNCVGNRNFSVSEIVLKSAESHFAWFCSLLHTSWAVEKHKDSFPQAPGFCADDVFIIAVYFNTDITHRYHPSTIKVDSHRMLAVDVKRA